MTFWITLGDVFYYVMTFDYFLRTFGDVLRTLYGTGTLDDVLYDGDDVLDYLRIFEDLALWMTLWMMLGSFGWRFMVLGFW